MSMLLFGCDEPRQFDYYLVLDPSLASEDLAEGRRPALGTGWVRDRFKTIGGATYSIWRTRDPIARVGFDEITNVVVREGIPSPDVEGEGRHWSAELELRGEPERRFADVRSNYPGMFLLVREGAVDLDFAPIDMGRGAGIPGGTFRSREEAERLFSSRPPDSIVFRELSAAEREYWTTQNRGLVDAAIWFLKCDPGAVQDLADGLVETLRRRPDLDARLAAVDCESDPP
ncbi:MAG: hypothetical protein CL908_02035 [Deltaproteobacteria bacterium]|nr:hypothetical protein [Deltaproteobacteria bacterium]